MRILRGLFLGCAVLCAAANTIAADKRIALVIGNGSYKKIAPLKNPVNDADALAERLKRLGFAVEVAKDLSYSQLVGALKAFSQKSLEADVRLFFFAGHGVQAKGRNYLLPVDVDIQSEAEIPARSAEVGELLERLGDAKRGVSIVILDACRVNPFAGNEIVLADGRRMKSRSLGGTGLARMEAPLGTLLAFSTAPGGVALDNPKEKNGLYTKHLLSRIDTAGLPIETLFKRVREDVLNETERKQRPWEQSSLTGDHVCLKRDADGKCGSQ